jgi:signal transduction histidine kinase
MRERKGLPIAAYLGALVALALASAFVAVVAILIWLPPRPPDVMRADIVTDVFQAGYDHMNAAGRPMQESGMVWEVRRSPPRQIEVPHMSGTRIELASRLDLRPEQVRIAAGRIARSDVFVFRVRDSEHNVTVDGDAVVIENDGGHVARHVVPMEGMREFEVRVPTPTPGAAPAETPEAPQPPSREIIRRSVTVAPPAPPTPPIPPPPMFAPAPPGTLLVSNFEIGAQLPDGRWLVMRQGRNWAEIGWIGRAMLVIGGTLTVLSLLAVLFARRLTRPIRNFSNAVQAVGVDPQSEPVLEEGPSELRGAARAVNTMQGRLRALIADRTKTLAAVAHDMRTPLMRLRLVAENASPEQREKMAKEIGEVEALVASFIAFARDDPAEEARVRLDLSALLQSIADDHAEHRRGVSFEGEERVIITGQSLGLKRLFGNLGDNALKYGASARIKLRRDENTVIVDIEDDGPGVPAAQREAVFEPFVRLNEEGTRGAGLGLAAARSIARAHGGDIVILDAEKGALLRVTLPG